MNPLIAIRLECLRLAAGVTDTDTSVVQAAARFEKYVRRGISRAELAGGCECSGSETAEAQRKRQLLLHEDARAAIDGRLESMTIAQLVTDADLMIPPQDSARIDAALARLKLRRGVTGDALAAWVKSGRLPGAKGRGYTP